MGGRTRFRAVVTALAVATTTTMAGAVLPAAAAPAPGDWSTSFEEGQPQPQVSTVEVGPDGPRQHGVTGTTSSEGSLLGQVADVTASAENAPGEVAANLADGSPDSKWLAFASTAWAQYELGAPAKAVTFSLTSANDAPERDPRAVTLRGSSDGKTWTDLDRETGIDFADRFTTKTFDIDNPGSYLYYRLDVTANHGGGIIQLADWDLSDGSTGEAGAGPMVTRTGSGPVSGYNIKPSSAGPASRRCATPAATSRTAAATPGTGSSTSTCPWAPTAPCPTRSSRTWWAATSPIPRRTPPSTCTSPTAPTSPTCARATSTASTRARPARARARSSTPTSGTP
ncbi:discoidin domain-containing protein [Phycicoccus flavus]|uniref:discoidin domain-containing protein n=1 Tax=Phycicoccus flavus TaxID=2502783 RepID=UPI002AC35ED7|nr:discoidin domain-containing protein [Phycicoccus flavus]